MGKLLRNREFLVGESENIHPRESEPDSVALVGMIRDGGRSEFIAVRESMRMYGYTSEELQSFYEVLDRLVREVAERELQITVFEMIHRLFEAADTDERDPLRLRHAVLKGWIASEALPDSGEEFHWRAA